MKTREEIDIDGSADFYRVRHITQPDCGCDDELLVGFFSTLDLAFEAVEKLRNEEGFRENPKGWDIDGCALDVSWIGGFTQGPTPSQED